MLGVHSILTSVDFNGDNEPLGSVNGGAMAGTDVVLSELERIFSGLDTRDYRTDGRVKMAVETRTAVIDTIGRLTRAIEADPRLKADPVLGEAFNAKFRHVRQTIATQQSKWRAVSIDQNFAEFEKDGNMTGEAILGFVRWARAQLA